MSRIGKQPIQIPSGVEVAIDGQNVSVKGPKGSLDLQVAEPITVARLVDRLEARAMVERRSDPFDRRCWRLHLTEASRPLLSEIDTQLRDLAGLACVGIDDSTLDTVWHAIQSMRDALAPKDALPGPIPDETAPNLVEQTIGSSAG